VRTAAVIGLTANHTPLESVGQSARSDVFVTLGVMEQERGAADFQSMIDFRRHVTIVQRRRHQAGFQTSQVMNDERRPIGHQRCDSITGFQSEGQVLCRQLGAGARELAPGHGGVARYQREIIRFCVEPMIQQIANRIGTRQWRSGKGHDSFLKSKQLTKNRKARRCAAGDA
jgi:hypothetical protein